jgi:hypothetical protein
MPWDENSRIISAWHAPPTARVERDPHNRSRCVTVDVQAVFSRRDNFKLVGGDRGQQNRLVYRQMMEVEGPVSLISSAVPLRRTSAMASEEKA